MGLDFSHSDAHWSYSGFNGFRELLCRQAGLGKLSDWQGFGGVKSWNDCKDDIKYFLHHSDCDGHITPAKLKKIIPRFKELLDGSGTSDSPPWDDEEEWNKEQGLILLKGMELAVRNNENLIFC